MPVAPTDPQPSLALALLGLLGLVLIAGTLAAWAGVFWRIVTRRPLWGPTAGPRVVSWHGGTILGVVILYVILATAVGTASQALRPPASTPPTTAKADAKLKPAPRPELSPRQRLLLQGVINGAVLLAVPWFLRRTTGTTLAELGLPTRDAWTNLNRGAGAFFLVGLPVYGLMRLALVIWPQRHHPIEEMLQLQLDAGTVLLALISAVVLAPLVEELLFRGLLLGWLQRLFDPTSVVTSQIEPEPLDGIPAWEPTPPPPWFRFLPDVITAALFASMHLGQWPAPLPLFLLALALGALMRRTGSLWAPIGLHAFFNGVSTLGMLLGSAAGVELEPKPASIGFPVPSACSCVDSVGTSGDWANLGVVPERCQEIGEKKVEKALGEGTRLNYDSAVTHDSLW